MARFDTLHRTLTVWPVPFGRGWRCITSSEHEIWLGGESNVVLAFDRATLRWTEHTLDSACLGPSVLALDARSGMVWVGGERGIIRYDAKAKEQRCYDSAGGMLSDQVTQIVAGDEWVWFVHPWRGLWGTRWSERAEQGQ
jgi:hypothetical protein